MKKTALFFLLILFNLGSLSAQNFIGKINHHPKNQINKAPGNLKILAVMVEFQEDNYDGTFGTGKFGSIYSEDYGNEILDPLPHDANYFQNHLEFAKNYFSKVSGSKLTVDYLVLPDIITVSQAMRNYSPPLNSDSLNELGYFSEEVWDLAAQNNPDIDFSEYDLFAIFHAGVGRDINTPGSLGIERDLPSVYLGINTLKDIFGQDFNGFPVNGTVPITNTMILPETESRELEGIGGTVLLELTINGLIVASIASHLGLPDLFNTETGLSAIGRFGLMDGQAIFAYNGTFPPEPSPWEKIRLGWIDPVIVNPGNIFLAVNSDYGDTTLIKLPINSSEYYLIENRNRDTENDGAVITYKLGNDTFTETFDADTTGFYSFDTDTLKGVIINVDQFDWALPGSGIVIWHIDEKIINENIAANSINNDLFNRGVDVEEADGIQDIGEEFSTIFGETVVGEGTEDDFWFASNESELYGNKFTPSTKPNTNSNSGANSLINIIDFSGISNKMNFEIFLADEQVRLKTFVNLSIEGKIKYITELKTDTSNNFYLLSDANELFISGINGSLYKKFANFSSKKPAAFIYREEDYVIGTLDNTLNILIDPKAPVITEPEQISLQLDSEITAHPVICEIGEDKRILVGTADGVLYNFSIGALLGGKLSEELRTPVFNDGSILQLSSTDFPANNLVGAISENSYWDNSGTEVEFANRALKLALTNDIRGEKVAVILTEGNRFYIVGSTGIINSFTIEGVPLSTFSLGKMNADEEIYIAASQENKIRIVNLAGYSLDNFPFSNESNPDFTGLPLSSNFSNSNLFAYSIDGDIYSLNNKSEISPSFPLTAGVNLSAVPILFEDKGMQNAISDSRFSLAAVTANNDFYVWNFLGASGLLFWSEEFANRYNNSYLEGPVVTETVEYFPEERVYNWPNPVFEDETYIRYFIGEDSNVEVRIFDLSGELVAELYQQGKGGLDNEITWNVQDVPSGVYFAHINADGNSGKQESKIIKIAVIK